FAAFGAEPVTTPANAIYSALKSGHVAAQENPLAILDGFRLYELLKYVSMTNHMWSGFNLMSHLATWQRLPPDIRSVIERNAAKYVRQQRADQAPAQCRPARCFPRPRARLQRYRSRGVPGAAPGGLRQMEGAARGQMLGVVGGRDRALGVIHHTWRLAGVAPRSGRNRCFGRTFLARSAPIWGRARRPGAMFRLTLRPVPNARWPVLRPNPEKRSP